MKLLEVKVSNRKGKKYAAVFGTEEGRTKTTHFGDSTMEDYLQHHDTSRREAYRARHEKDLNTQDPTRAGYLAYYILWGNSTSLSKNIADFKRKFSL